MKKPVIFFVVQVVIVFVVGLTANWILAVPQNLPNPAFIALGAAIPTTFAVQKLKLLNNSK